MATTVKITETYDMKTTVGKVGLIGIHTPQLSVIRRLYPGLLKNHRFFRFLKCDVVGACASVLPADPLQVGVEAGDVAPEDMFNPILYSAVTNESWDTLVGRIRALSAVSPLNSVDSGNLPSVFGTDANFNIYYSLLAENGKWRKAMPQAGFRISGLVPLAHTLVSTFGNVGPNMGNTIAAAPDEADYQDPQVPSMDIPEIGNDGLVDSDGGKSVYFRGRTVRMPKFPCHVGPEAIEDIPYPSIPSTTVLALVVPPGKLHEFYYRMRVSWTIRFENVISTNEIGYFGDMNVTGSNSYGKSYTFSSSKSVMETDTDTASSDGVEINKVMES